MSSIDLHDRLGYFNIALFLFTHTNLVNINTDIGILIFQIWHDHQGRVVLLQRRSGGSHIYSFCEN